MNRRLTRQVMTEALVLCHARRNRRDAARAHRNWAAHRRRRDTPPWLHLGIDARAVAFSLLIVAITALSLGSFRRSSCGRQGHGALAATGSRTAGSLPERRVLNGLVVVEIALAAVLLASGGLLVRAYANLRDVDPGFRPDGVASFRISLPERNITNGSGAAPFLRNAHCQNSRDPGRDTTPAS